MAHAALQTVQTKPLANVARLPLLSCTVAASAVLLLLALALPSFSGNVYVADDLGQFHLPVRAFYAEALKQGQSFDWWPALFGGFYVTGEGQHGPYHPLHLVMYRWLPLRAAFNLEVVLSYAWMLLGTYAWLRRRLPRADAALFGALCFTFSGFDLLHLPHVNAIAIIAQLPWLLWAIEVAICDPRPRWRVIATVAVSLLTASQLLLGYPQYVWFSLLLQAGYVGWLLYNRPSGRARTALTLAVAVGIGFLLAGVQLLPTFDALAHSTRRDTGVAFAESGSLHPLNLVQLVAPYLFETRVVGQNTHELGLYAGCVPLVLCVWLWIRRKELGALRPLVVATTVMGLFALWMALGEYGYIYRVQTWLPVVGKFRFPTRMIVLFHLATAILAAAALALLAKRQPARVPLLPRRFAPVWMLCGTSVLVVIAARLVWPQHLAHWPAIVAGPVLVIAAAVLLRLADGNSRAALTALVLLCALDLGIYGLSYSVWGHTESIETFAVRCPVPPGDAGRMLLESPGGSERGLRVGNAALLSGWTRIDGYAGLEPAKILDYRQPHALRVAGVVWPKPEGGVEGKTEPLPPARLVTSAVLSSNPARDIALFDPANIALVEPGFDTPYAMSEPAGHATISAQSPGRIVVDTHSTAPNLLVINQSWHSGWQAKVDGQPATVERVNGDFFGCVVPPGDHRVEFDFHPASLRHGRSVSAIGLVSLVLGMVWLVRSNKPAAH